MECLDVEHKSLIDDALSMYKENLRELAEKETDPEMVNALIDAVRKLDDAREVVSRVKCPA